MKGTERKPGAYKYAALLPGLLACGLLWQGRAAAQGFNSAAAGTAGVQFLKIASGARGAALGEAYSALADDAFALDWNPAGLINIQTKSMVFMHAPYLAGTFADYFAYGENAGEMGAWGLSAKYMNFGELRRRDASGADMGVFTPYDAAVNIGLACYVSGFNKEPKERFVLGATGKLVRSKITSTDSTISADIGLLSPYMFDDTFRMAISAQNIMGSLRFDKEETPLPLILRVGSVVRLSNYVNFTADVIAARDHLPYLAAGSEVRVRGNEDMEVFLRAGFNTRAISDLTGARNVTFGAGLRLNTYRFDYAFSPFGEIGSVHRISISMTFSDKSAEK